jgi:hypothetical protein
VIKSEKLNYISEYPEKANFWPASIAGAVMYCDEMENLPQPYFKNTFDSYYKELEGRLKPGATYRYTPYEARIIEAFVRMNQKERALKLLRFILSNRKPIGWNQFTEVVNSPERLPTIFGDMPHTWVSAEYINSVRSLFVYESNNKLILGHGIDENWLFRKEGVSIKNFPTYYGNISYDVKRDGDFLKINVQGSVVCPPEGFVFKSPLSASISDVKINGSEWDKFSNDEVIFNKLPAAIEINYGTKQNSKVERRKQ